MRSTGPQGAVAPWERRQDIKKKKKGPSHASSSFISQILKIVIFNPSKNTILTESRNVVLPTKLTTSVSHPDTVISKATLLTQR
jgi:hypothetical protein